MGNIPPPELCLKIINDAIYLNNIGGMVGRQKRDRLCDKWFLTYFDNCQMTNENIIESTVFGEVTRLFVDAIQSYRFGHFEASMAMLRASIDALFFCVGEKKFVWLDRENWLYGVQPASPMNWWEKAKPCEVDDKMWSNAELIRDRGYLTENEFDKLKKLREKGNFSAHFFAQRRKEFSKMVKRLAKADSESARTSVIKSLKQYTSSKEATDAMEEGFHLIVKVQKAHVRYLLNAK